MNFNPERSKLGAAFFFLARRTPLRFIHSLSRAYRTKGYGLLVERSGYLSTFRPACTLHTLLHNPFPKANSSTYIRGVLY